MRVNKGLSAMLLSRSLGAVKAMLLATKVLGSALPITFNATEPETLGLWGVGDALADGEMSIMSGCDQRACPDNQREQWDFIQSFSAYFPKVGIRFDRCGKCSSFVIGHYGDGCIRFNNCEWDQTQEICADTSKRRAHWYGPGGKVCYTFATTPHAGCFDQGGFSSSPLIWNPTKVACTW
ncbi:uncharacterized protein B0I36DRAFT_366376 [Microdochium trichocladiopsis]|uniref:Cyanovirin-N domain-containing protein n=1 Tax=Microdochium trichocladiopsis TaxID=1682393 RepID=A0A9P9BPD2_9PEZI|nr:uncharacterized protein B0I36DRAFT_366376 [Microdochium trichocladiopsis]KAH7024431.1 hypothetical protein B0I36DRAFT_366376 [Microdochium trichocladiopsis]